MGENAAKRAFHGNFILQKQQIEYLTPSNHLFRIVCLTQRKEKFPLYSSVLAPVVAERARDSDDEACLTQHRCHREHARVCRQAFDGHKKTPAPRGWRFLYCANRYCGLRRPKPGRWPEPAGAPRRLPDGASSTSFGPVRLGLVGRLLTSLGRSATGAPRPAGTRSVRPDGLRAGRGASSRAGRDGRSPSMCG